MRADLDEIAVLGAGIGDGLTEPHRIAQVGHPVVRAEHRRVPVNPVVLISGIFGAAGAK